MQSRRKFLSGAGGAVLTTALVVRFLIVRNQFAMLADAAALLAELAPHQRDIVRLAMANNPALTLAEALEMLNAFGL
jgi:hypothetical protein